MNMHTIKYNGTQPKLSRAGQVEFTFHPGLNQVPVDVWKLLMGGCNSARTMVKQGILERVPGIPTPLDRGGVGIQSNIAELNVEEALEVIGFAHTKEQLDGLREQEEARKSGPRVTITRALGDKETKAGAMGTRVGGMSKM